MRFTRAYAKSRYNTRSELYITRQMDEIRKMTGIVYPQDEQQHRREKIGTEKNTTWVFEDALYAAKTAKANGYNLVGIFDESEENTDELKRIADIYIHNYKEILI